MGLENTILLITRNADTGQEERITFDKERHISTFKDNVKTNCIFIGSVKREDLGRIVVVEAELPDLARIQTKDQYGIVPALRFYNEEEKFECHEVSPKLIIGARLALVCEGSNKILGKFIEPRRKGGEDYWLEFIGDIQGFEPTKSRYSIKQDRRGIEFFARDDSGRYELISIRLGNRNAYVLINTQNSNEIYLTQGVGFTRITDPLHRIEIIDSKGKVHEGLSLGEIDISILYGKHTMIVKKAEANNGAN